jgi:hypothetical protein
VVPVAAVFGAFLAWFWARFLRRRRLPGRTLIISPRNSTVIAADGAVRSTQTARLELPRAELQRLWAPVNLENLGRTYWLFLSRCTLGLIRVRYTDHDRSVVLIARPLTLLRFEAPEYLLEPERGRISWQIRDGLLVSRSGAKRGGLSLEVRRDQDEADPASLTIEVEVSNFYPSIASGLSTAVYEATQAFVHVLVTHAFLRSLATLELAESKVGKLRQEDGPVDRTEPRSS